MPQVRLRGVQIFRMIPLVGTHILGGMLRIRGSWGREITLLMLAFGNVLERVQRTTLAIGKVGRMRMQGRPHAGPEGYRKAQRGCPLTCGGGQRPR